MHTCPFCGEECDCDWDDTGGLPVPDDCPHLCEELEDETEGEREDEDDPEYVELADLPGDASAEYYRTCPICKEEYELMDCPNCTGMWSELVEPTPYCERCHGTGAWGICSKHHDETDVAVWQRGRLAWWWYCTQPKLALWLFCLVHPVEWCVCGEKIQRVLWWELEMCERCGIPF